MDFIYLIMFNFIEFVEYEGVGRIWSADRQKILCNVENGKYTFSFSYFNINEPIFLIYLLIHGFKFNIALTKFYFIR